MAIKEFEKPTLKDYTSIPPVEKDATSHLAPFKSKEELIGEIISLLQSPAKNVISALKSSGAKISGVLKTLSEKNDDN